MSPWIQPPKNTYIRPRTLYIFDEKKRIHGTKGFIEESNLAVDFITFT